jgi:hypothetical protein
LRAVIEIALDYGWQDSQATEIVARYPELSEDEQDALGDVHGRKSVLFSTSKK